MFRYEKKKLKTHVHTVNAQKLLPMNIRKKFVFQQAMSIKSEAKTKKKWGSQGEKLAKRVIETTAVTQKSTTKSERHCLQSKFFPSLLDRQLKFMLQHPTVWLDRKQLKYLSKELLLFDFCTRGRLLYERLWQTALADHCINKPLNNLSWSYWRLIWRQNCFDKYHWALGRSEKFHFEQFEI